MPCHDGASRDRRLPGLGFRVQGLGFVDEMQCLMSFSPGCWQPLGPARAPTGQQLPAYCKPVGRGGHKQAKQFKPGQSRGRFAKLTHALQKLQVISRMN